MVGKVLQVRTKSRSEGMAPAHELRMLEGRGIQGDLYFDDESRTRRQVLLLDKSTLDQFGYQPGVLREQILVDLPGLQSLLPGTRLNVGSAVLEITDDCAPCLTMASYVGEDGVAFVNKMLGKRGMLASVVGTGTAKPGDPVRLAD